MPPRAEDHSVLDAATIQRIKRDSGRPADINKQLTSGPASKCTILSSETPIAASIREEM